MTRTKVDLVKLSDWWWSLTDEERAVKRQEFMKRYHSDPEFSSQVQTLLREQEENSENNEQAPSN
jgi:hypothetical protein